MNALIQRGIEVATWAHAGQVRKGTDMPYVSHPLSVMVLLQEVTDDTDTLCAGLLHDVLEDVDPSRYNEEDMERDFGPNVLRIVKTVTKDAEIASWQERSQAYIEKLQATKCIPALEVCAADKLHNVSTILSDYEMYGEVLWQRFNAPKEKQLWWYETVGALLLDRLGETLHTVRLSERVESLRRAI